MQNVFSREIETAQHDTARGENAISRHRLMAKLKYTKASLLYIIVRILKAFSDVNL